VWTITRSQIPNYIGFHSDPRETAARYVNHIPTRTGDSATACEQDTVGVDDSARSELLGKPEVKS